MKIELIAKSVYGLFGVLFLLAGAVVMLLHTGLLPGPVQSTVLRFARDDPYAMHLIQEFASILVFAGLISLWFVKHYRLSKAYHWAMTTFWVLFALAHWFDGSGSPRSVTGAVINTIPFILFLLIGFVRWNSERHNASEASQ